ncbi:ribosomal protein L4 [Zopfia rhizophila CBS 207.26]|uniref:Large ribosomal subunit protein uL4m n=1 Tax=Zopfia rhizophila CBS 207.26 TaxID=1314779 RepID=A0A6A6DRI2_9PEZI|nr:ribosomal protein L4 [Zopfia rhizophila CBS 207.26]
MASNRISAPIRSAVCQLNKLSIAHDVVPNTKSNPFKRSITTSTSTQASVSTITRSFDNPIPPPPQPFGSSSVLATIHSFPSLEPLHFQSYPSNHLYLPTRRDILHRAVIYEGDKTRLGTASTKWRDDIHGSGRKMRPQKGTGRARLGDKKSPMLRGGGIAFGPKPRDFSTKLQRKVYDLAWRTALSYRFRKGELVIVDNSMEIDVPSTNYLADMFNAHGWGNADGRSLLVTLGWRPNLMSAIGKIGNHGRTRTWWEVDVKDLLEMGRVVIEKEALGNILLSHQSDLTHSTRVKGLVMEPEPEPMTLERAAELDEGLNEDEWEDLEESEDMYASHEGEVGEKGKMA